MAGGDAHDRRGFWRTMGRKTLRTLDERYPTKETLDAAIAGMEDGTPERPAQAFSSGDFSY